LKVTSVHVPAGGYPGSVNSEQQLRDKLRKITALYEGARTAGERNAAAAAIARLKAAMAAIPEGPVEIRFIIPDPWQRRLFAALCRRYSLEPYRYTRQRRTTMIVKAPPSFVDKTLWPEYRQLQATLQEYLNEVTERIIREEVYRDAGDAPERN
jgi:tRNA nucleotidyltransferase (CCA-adding enzyme)